MFKINKINKFISKNFQYFLFAWYIISLYVFYEDNTISTTIKFCGEVVNVTMIYTLFKTITNSFSRNNFLNMSIAIFDLLWFLFYSYFDVTNVGYSDLLAIFYGFIDVSSIVFLIFTINKNSYIFFALSALYFKKIAHGGLNVFRKLIGCK